MGNINKKQEEKTYTEWDYGYYQVSERIEEPGIFQVEQFGKRIAVIVADDENVAQIRKDLDKGKDINGWNDGTGGTVRLVEPSMSKELETAVIDEPYGGLKRSLEPTTYITISEIEMSDATTAFEVTTEVGDGPDRAVEHHGYFRSLIVAGRVYAHLKANATNYRVISRNHVRPPTKKQQEILEKFEANNLSDPAQVIYVLEALGRQSVEMYLGDTYVDLYYSLRETGVIKEKKRR